MMRRFEILKGSHMGPLQRNIQKGDVIGWDLSTRVLTLNGVVLQESKSMDFERAIDMLVKQMAKVPESPWAKELDPISVTTSQFDVKTGTQVVLPILGCLKAAEEYLDTHEEWAKLKKVVQWTPKNEEQYQFLKRFLEAKSVVDLLGDKLKRKADHDVSVINAWLKQHGFDIQLSPARGLAFAVASILNVMVEWVKKGKVTSIYTPKGKFPAVSISSGMDGLVCEYLDRTVHPFPIAMLSTKSGERVYMSALDYLSTDTFAITDNLSTDTFAITDKMDQLRKATRGSPMSCDGVVFPMVDYNRQVDISWICGMTTGSDGWLISEALQQTKFRMNEKGARAESAAAMMLKCASVGDDTWIQIDRPFILWIEHPGIETPLFAGVFAEDVWKKPESL